MSDNQQVDIASPNPISFLHNAFHMEPLIGSASVHYDGLIPIRNQGHRATHPYAIGSIALRTLLVIAFQEHIHHRVCVLGPPPDGTGSQDDGIKKNAISNRGDHGWMKSEKRRLSGLAEAPLNKIAESSTASTRAHSTSIVIFESTIRSALERRINKCQQAKLELAAGWSSPMRRRRREGRVLA